jgi:predicted transcriptional regulator
MLCVRIAPSLRRRLTLIAASSGRSVQALAAEALEAVCRHHDMQACMHAGFRGRAAASGFGSRRSGYLSSQERQGLPESGGQVQFGGRGLQARTESFEPPPSPPSHPAAAQSRRGERSGSHEPDAVR